jgi:PAS domain S-box-containing protein
MTDSGDEGLQRKARILFVEDEATLREHLAEALSDEFLVDTAGDGTQALKAVLRTRPDLVVTDVVMPELDGIELLKTLRSTPSTQMIPVLLISGLAPEEMRIEGFEEGADSYLEKPYSERELRARIRSMLQLARRRAELVRDEAQRQALAERATLLESITDPFYALDRSWRFTYANQRALDYFGKPREELLGRSLWDLFPVGRGTEFQRQYERALCEQRSVSFEAFSPFSARWIEVHAYPTPQGLAVDFRDISERKQAEAALRQAEERYRAFVINSTEAIWRYELDEPLDIALPIELQLEHLYRHAYLAEANDAMARMYGYERAEELVGARLAQTLPREDAAAQAYLKRMIECGYRLTDVESAESNRYGQMHYFANSMVPVIENRHLIRAWGMQRDITESKQAQEHLREADRRKDEFLAILAHELRNPLAPLRNGVQILRLRARSDATLERTLSMMDRQMSHLVRLVDDLLDVGRITRGKLELKSEKLLLTSVLASAIEASRPLLEAKNHHLAIEPDSDKLFVEGDASRLAQVFSNLLANAAKYTDDGGRIVVKVGREGDEAIVYVQDNGIGIPHEAAGSVFDLFSQVRAHQSRTDGGLGIGLALVQWLVEMHRGSVSVASEGLGKGSTFTVRLPLASAPVERALPVEPGPAGESAQPRRRILVVDDNLDAAASLTSLLTMQGHDVQIAADGREALDRASTLHPDLIFLDLGMPRMDGFEAARRIRALPGGEDVLIVALTGWGQPADRQRSREAGFDQHLVKPVSFDTLTEILLMQRERPSGTLPRTVRERER